jgi:hypothetical protein
MPSVELANYSCHWNPRSRSGKREDAVNSIATGDEQEHSAISIEVRCRTLGGGKST